MTTTIHQHEDYHFSERTLLIIEYYEEMFDISQLRLEPERLDNRVRWVNELIAEYDESETDYNKDMRLENAHKNYNFVCKSLNDGKLPIDVRNVIYPKKYKEYRHCTVKQIAITIHLLKVAQKMGRKAFQKFILIPDVSYILGVIEKDNLGDLKYLNEVA